MIADISEESLGASRGIRRDLRALGAVRAGVPMKSVVVQIDRDQAPAEASADLLARSREAAEGRGVDRECTPSFVLAFLPPGSGLEGDLEALAGAFPDSLRFGCEAVTQFGGARATGEGIVQLFWLEGADHGVDLTVVHAVRPGGEGRPQTQSRAQDQDELEGVQLFEPGEIDAAAAALEGADAAFLLSDGMRFPAWELLEVLRERLPEDAPPMVGGLASQREPIARPGARVFRDREIYESACLLATFRGVEMDVEMVRGWDPASPIFTVTEARGNVVYTIDDEPAPEFFRRFFTIDGHLAPMPEAAHRFPLIIEGPRPERRGVYRSMQAFDQPTGAVSFWGDFEPGDRIRLGMGNDASLLRTAGELFAEDEPEAAVLYSCVGREAVLGELAGREVETIHGALRGVSLAGFFTFGEIGPTAAGPGCAFYNQMAVLAMLRERRP